MKTAQRVIALILAILMVLGFVWYLISMLLL